MNIYERLKRVADIKPGCFLGDGCSMHEIARDALIELAGKEAVINELEKDVAFYKRYQTEKYAKEERNRLLVLATKHCPRGHHDWQEILRIAGDA